MGVDASRIDTCIGASDTDAANAQRKSRNNNEKDQQTDDSKSNYIIEIEADQKYNEHYYNQLEKEIKEAKAEMQRIITQYNLKIHQLNSKYSALEIKYQNELQQRASTLRELQDALNQNQSLKTQQTTNDLEHDTEIHQYEVSITKLQQQIHAYQHSSATQKNEENNKLQNEILINELRKKVQDEKQSSYIYNERIQSLENELQKCNQRKEEKLDLDVNEKPKPFSDTQRQMDVLFDEGAKMKSLYLCTKQVQINGKDMSFKTWLAQNLNERATEMLWKQVKSNRVNAKVFISLLATTAMIYKTKLHQARTNSKDIPQIDSVKLKKYVQHFGVWIIRNKGIETNEMITVEVQTEERIVRKCKLSLTQNEFAQNISQWVGDYVEQQGALDAVI